MLLFTNCHYSLFATIHRLSLVLLVTIHCVTTQHLSLFLLVTIHFLSSFTIYLCSPIFTILVCHYTVTITIHRSLYLTILQCSPLVTFHYYSIYTLCQFSFIISHFYVTILQSHFPFQLSLLRCYCFASPTYSHLSISNCSKYMRTRCRTRTP